MNIVWFKRDLRITQHTPLHMASQTEQFIPLYIFEPELWTQPGYTYRQFTFLKDSLIDLNNSLSSFGNHLIIKIGNAVDILQEINTLSPIQNIYSHEETGNNWTYQRDLTVQKWCKYNHVNWQEYQQFGVFRRLKSRDGWSKKWHDFVHMNNDLQLKHNQNKQTLISGHHINELDQFVPTIKGLSTQKGGQNEAKILLKTFLNHRGERYHKHMSSPVTAREGCSRLSPHIAFGTIDFRFLYHSIMEKKIYISQLARAEQRTWKSALSSILSRLRWHCHFIQKLEDQPDIELKSLHSAYDSLDKKLNSTLFEAWKDGSTGFPMIDACMKSLKQTGWLNFRMRAMVVSFACHHLWLPWKPVAHYLASCFTDYEPGIHYSQIQMQAGSTGINAIRIYNPIKQGLDHDPQCIFIKKWIPQLQDIDPALIHSIHENTLFSNQYIPPIIDEKIQRQQAAKHLYQLRKSTAFKTEDSKIVLNHGRRKDNSQKSKQN